MEEETGAKETLANTSNNKDKIEKEHARSESSQAINGNKYKNKNKNRKKEAKNDITTYQIKRVKQKGREKNTVAECCKKKKGIHNTTRR